MLTLRKTCSLAALSALLTLTPLPGDASAETVSISRTSASMAPYYWTENNKIKGILPDILNGLKGYNVNFITIARNRLDHLFKEDQLDMSILHPAYTKADDILFFLPLHIQQETILITSTDHQNKFKDINEIKNATICAKRGYVYINMKDRWTKQKLTRIDLDTHKRIIDLVDKKSCDLGITSKLIFNYEVNRAQSMNVRNTSIVLSKVPRFLAVRKKQDVLYKKLEKHLTHIQADGSLRQIIQRHAPNTP